MFLKSGVSRNKRVNFLFVQYLVMTYSNTPTNNHRKNILIFGFLQILTFIILSYYFTYSYSDTSSITLQQPVKKTQIGMDFLKGSDAYEVALVNKTKKGGNLFFLLYRIGVENLNIHGQILDTYLAKEN